MTICELSAQWEKIKKGLAIRSRRIELTDFNGGRVELMDTWHAVATGAVILCCHIFGLCGCKVQGMFAWAKALY